MDKPKNKNKDGKKKQWKNKADDGPMTEWSQWIKAHPWISALVVLALLAVLLWYLNRQGYINLQRWLPARMGYSPSAPPYEGF